jgi:hypothetical protein
LEYYYQLHPDQYCADFRAGVGRILGGPDSSAVEEKLAELTVLIEKKGVRHVIFGFHDDCAGDLAFLGHSSFELTAKKLAIAFSRVSDLVAGLGVNVIVDAFIIHIDLETQHANFRLAHTNRPEHKYLLPPRLVATAS